MSSSFVHLHVHSQYSILDAASSVEELAETAKAFDMPAVALTDHGNLYGAIDFYKACQAAKVKPLIGCELYVAPESRFDKLRTSGVKNAHHLVLIAKNSEGYHNLCKLSSMGFVEGFYYHPRIDHEVLKKHAKGLVCLSACLSGRIPQMALNGTQEALFQEIRWYQELFGEDYYLELQRHHMKEEDLQADGFLKETWLLQYYQDYIQKQTLINQRLIEASKECQIRLAATNDSHYIRREDWRAHEILLNIQSGEPCEIWEKDSLGNPKFRIPNPKRRTYPSHELYFKSSEEMRALFHDLPEAADATLEIASKCELQIDFKTKHYPVYLPPSLQNKTFSKEERAQEAEKFLWQLCEEGLPKRYTPERLAKVQEHYPDRDPLEVVKDRLKYEMSIIVPKEMSDYLLIVWDFINWAKNQGIPMGPGRGSGVGSIVLYLIGVTDIEPLRFHLFFERFINPERISYPDIDVDICMDRRSDVIAYTLHKYGKENIAQIITFGTMKAKMTIKDVGRVLSVPLPKVNAIAKLVPDDLNITLEKALEKDPDLLRLSEEDEEARRILDIGKKLEGSIRNTGIHAAGIVICGEPLTEHIPICNAKDSDMSATQYSMKPVELVGMLKIDFLGLKTLTSIKMCVDAIKENSGAHIDWMNLPLDDGPTFSLLNQGKTLGIFQLESGGMQELARQLHLDKFEEIIAVGSLYRPGPMEMIPSFINRKHGREPIEYDHPWMKEILSETYGIMVYQEQVMQIASKLANFSLGEGDVLRRAMGKKDMEQMAQQREKFRLGALANGIEEHTSMRIFDKMEKFAAYGFNKSHAAAYAYLSYVTAFLKANYPKEWLAALMTCDLHDITKVSKFITECQAMQIPVLAPDVNESGETFVATSQGIRFAMTGIKGVGAGVVASIVNERKAKGVFTSFYQFLKRIDTKKVGKKMIENLVDAGCFDFTEWSRDTLREQLEPMYEAAVKEQKEIASGFMSLFGNLEDINASSFSKPPPAALQKTSKLQLLLKEKELLGFFLTGHPMEAYREVLKRLSCVPLCQIDEMNGDAVFRAAFIIESLDIKLASKSQKKFAILKISDGGTRYEMPIWPDLFEQKGHLLQENQLIYAVLQIEKRDEEKRISCRWFDLLTQANEDMLRECDHAFDKAKHMAGRPFRTKEKKQETESVTKPKVSSETKEKKTENVTLCLKAPLESFRLSHVMHLKRLFEQHRGETPVKLIFDADQQEVASLHIESRWGVQLSPALQKELQVLSKWGIDLLD